MNIEKIEKQIRAILAENGLDTKIEITEVKRSLKLADIVEAQKDNNCFYLNEKGVHSCNASTFASPFYHTDQIKESSAKKTMLYGQIQRIADFANCDWVANKKTVNWIVYFDQNVIKVGHIPYHCGQPVFKSKELAEQAYSDNKELFDEFFKL